MIKDTPSLEGMRQAAVTCDLMLARLQEVLSRPGIPAWQAQVEMEDAGRLNGAEAVFSWFVSVPRPDHPRVRREENARFIQIGDSIVVGVIILQHGFYGHTLRMFSIGEPSEEQQRVWQAVSEAQSQAAALFRPGKSISAPNRMAETVMFEKFPEDRHGDKYPLPALPLYWNGLCRIPLCADHQPGCPSCIGGEGHVDPGGHDHGNTSRPSPTWAELWGGGGCVCSDASGWRVPVPLPTTVGRHRANRIIWRNAVIPRCWRTAKNGPITYCV